MTLRVMSWNMGTVTRFRQDRAWHFLMAVQPDIALVQETKPPRWALETYRAFHYEPLTRWGSLVMLRDLTGELVAIPSDSPLSRFRAYVSCVQVDLPSAKQTLVASVHAVAREVAEDWIIGFSVERVRRPMFQRPLHNDLAFHALVELIADRPFIVGGDWNTSRLFDDNRQHPNAGSAFFDRATRAGWVESVWKYHGQEQRTWFRTGDRHFQLDHLFCDVDRADHLVEAKVLSQAAEPLRLSDHAPLLVEFSEDDAAVTADPINDPSLGQSGSH